jgi:muconolactone D-isomerase
MEFLVEFDLTIPEEAAEADVAARTEAEGAASSELARAGHLERLWTVSRAPSRWRGLGLYRADDEAEMDALLRALPLYDWMDVMVTPLEAHPHDPGSEPSAAHAGREPVLGSSEW